MSAPTTSPCFWARATALRGTGRQPGRHDTAAVATGDFTGNGNLGLAVVDQGSDSVTILPGNGDGTFQQSLTVALPPGSGASAIVAADFNDDGRTDLAVADPILDEVSIFLGNGDGTFDSLPPIPVPGGPYAIAAGDFTGNGHIDLAVADRSIEHRHHPPGQRRRDIHARADDPRSDPADPTNPSVLPDAIVAGNFTGNGHLDLAVADHGPTTSRSSWATATARFKPSSRDLAREGRPTSLHVAGGRRLPQQRPHRPGRRQLPIPFNGDTVDVLLGNGDGTFQAPDVMSLGYGVYPVGDRRGRLHQQRHPRPGHRRCQRRWDRRLLGVPGQRRRHVPGPDALRARWSGGFDRPRRRAISPATAGPTWRSPGRVPTTCKCS